MTVTITEIELLIVSTTEANEIEFPESSPFDDNGSETDGREYFLSRERDEFEVPETIRLTEVTGWLLEGYETRHQEAFRAAGIHRFMGNDSQKFAYFLATEAQADMLAETLD